MENGKRTLEERLARLEAVEEIQNLMGRYAHLQSLSRYDDIVSKLYSQDPGRSYEEGAWGVIQDTTDHAGSILEFYQKRYGLAGDAQTETMRKGKLVVNALTSQVVEVSGDGKSANGLWIATGHETTVISPGEEAAYMPGSSRVTASEPRHVTEWVWLKYEGYFVHESDGWRIMHLHIYEIVRCPFERDWVDDASMRDLDDALFDTALRFGRFGFPPALPTTFHWQYGPDRFVPNQPYPPERCEDIIPADWQ